MYDINLATNDTSNRLLLTKVQTSPRGKNRLTSLLKNKVPLCFKETKNIGELSF